jgi:hypothetical protein
LTPTTVVQENDALFVALGLAGFVVSVIGSRGLADADAGCAPAMPTRRSTATSVAGKV